MGLKNLLVIKLYKLWIRWILLIILLFLLLIALFNYLLDPLWSFNNFKFNKYKNSYNERVLKTNLLAYANIEYDGILLGSSRSSYINATIYNNMKIFNYSSSFLQVSEYAGFINNASKLNVNHDIVILGVDFFTFLVETKPDYIPEKYYNDTQDLLNRFKILISYDTFKKAKKNLKIDENFIYERVYDKNYNVFTSVRNKEDNKRNINDSVKKFNKMFYLKKKPIKNLKIIMNSLIINNPNTKFVVFSTPISKELFNKIIKDKELYLLYEQWIKDLVSVFSEINHFMYLNNIANNSSTNFYDSHHVYPFVGDTIFKDLKNKKETTNMMIINQENINEKLLELRLLHKINQK